MAGAARISGERRSSDPVRPILRNTPVTAPGFAFPIAHRALRRCRFVRVVRAHRAETRSSNRRPAHKTPPAQPGPRDTRRRDERAVALHRDIRTSAAPHRLLPTLQLALGARPCARSTPAATQIDPGHVRRGSPGLQGAILSATRDRGCCSRRRQSTGPIPRLEILRCEIPGGVPSTRTLSPGRRGTSYRA